MEYRYEGHALSGSQSFVCRESRKSATMIKGSLYICDDCCATSCDAEGIANVAGFFSFANPSRFFFLSQNLQIFGLALRKKAQYVVVILYILLALKFFFKLGKDISFFHNEIIIFFNQRNFEFS
jgi:hypothetical protein